MEQMYVRQGPAAATQRWAWQHFGADAAHPTPSLTRYDTFSRTVDQVRRKVCGPFVRPLLAAPADVFARRSPEASVQPLCAGTRACWLGAAVTAGVVGSVLSVLGAALGAVAGLYAAVFAPPDLEKLCLLAEHDEAQWATRTADLGDALQAATTHWVAGLRTLAESVRSDPKACELAQRMVVAIEPLKPARVARR